MKLLAIDLDQTLLHTDKTISDFTKAVFEKVNAQTDIKVIVATGRSIMRADDYAKAIHATGIISLNGAKTLYQDTLVSEYDVDEAKVVGLLRLLLDVPDTYINVTYPSVILTNNETWAKGDHVLAYSDYKHIDTREVQKISLRTMHPELIKAIDFSLFDCKLVHNAKEPDYFVILHKNVSKLKGLCDLCEVLHTQLEDVIAFGDDYNDLDMLTHAGNAVVVANAPLEMQAIAKYICRSNDEDGVAHWINEHVL